jgi:hypothetical protein
MRINMFTIGKQILAGLDILMRRGGPDIRVIGVIRSFPHSWVLSF